MNILKYVKNIVKKLLYLFKLRISRIGPYTVFNFDSFLYRHLAVHNKLTFVQIGANDGVMNDPIYKFNMANKSRVSGYVLEPLPDIYQRLVINYENSPDIIPVNLAIHNSEKEMVLHRVKPEYAEKSHSFAGGIASFNSEHWVKTTLIPNEDCMEGVKVKCITFQDFIETRNLCELDLLIIDTEGYDYDILMAIDFSLIKPRMIRFEHGVRNNIMPSDKFMALCQSLNKNGYQVITESYDATAYIIDADDLIFE